MFLFPSILSFIVSFDEGCFPKRLKLRKEFSSKCFGTNTKLMTSTRHIFAIPHSGNKTLTNVVIEGKKLKWELKSIRLTLPYKTLVTPCS